MIDPAAVWHASGDTVPLTPDAGTARDWLVGELAKPSYQAAKPTWFDLLSQSVKDWIASLFGHGGGHLEPVLLLIGLVIAVALVVGALIAFGVPRLNRRRRSPARGALFGIDDTRDAAQLRASAAEAAGRGDWRRAVEEAFRAVARRADDASLVAVTPGTTAGGFARAAALRMPRSADALHAGAGVFDLVRYLDGEAGEADYRALCELDDAVAALAAAGTRGGGDSGRAGRRHDRVER